MRTLFLVCLAIIVIFGWYFKYYQWVKIWGPKEERDKWLTENSTFYRVSMFIVGILLFAFPLSVWFLGLEFNSQFEKTFIIILTLMASTVFILSAMFYKQILFQILSIKFPETFLDSTTSTNQTQTESLPTISFTAPLSRYICLLVSIIAFILVGAFWFGLIETKNYDDKMFMTVFYLLNGVGFFVLSFFAPRLVREIYELTQGRKF